MEEEDYTVRPFLQCGPWNGSQSVREVSLSLGQLSCWFKSTLLIKTLQSKFTGLSSRSSTSYTRGIFLLHYQDIAKFYKK